jgi:UDP-N-acetylglucosamine 2-epimerase
MRIATIIGARPQFVKAAPVSRAIRREHEEILVHTGQHYDALMSDVFFDELGIPSPDHHLCVGSGPHGAQTGAMLERIERVLSDERPDWVLVYGDTNSTLAGALAAAKLRIPLAHVEAGLRSYNRAMPEEINRVLTDHLSTLLFCPSVAARENLEREGITDGVRVVGDVMTDAVAHAVSAGEGRSRAPDALGVRDGEYLLVTVHRSENTDDRAKLSRIVRALDVGGERIVFPVHPRTREALIAIGYAPPGHVTLTEPLGYLDMLRMLRGARLLLTDSGGLQKEAYWLGVPCITLRDETEWVETVQAGWNVLAGSDTSRIRALMRQFAPPAERPALYGDGHVSSRIVAALSGPGAGGRQSAGRARAEAPASAPAPVTA